MLWQSTRPPCACRPTRIVLTLGAGWLLAGCATPTNVALDETWFACTRDRECAIAEDPTCTHVPINKQYAALFKQHIRETRPLELAQHPCSKSAVRYAAVCEATRCTSDARGLARTRGTRSRR